MMQPDLPEQDAFLHAALVEDIGAGDITSTLLIAPDTLATKRFVARESMTVCGLPFVIRLFALLSADVACVPRVVEGDILRKGTVLMEISGSARALLAGERVALNLLQYLSAIASETAQYVQMVEDLGVQILDTRKILPLYRAFAKYAVHCGGGVNHRMRLDDAVLIKDNHIAVVGSVAEAVRRALAGAPVGMKVQVECDTLMQAEEAVMAGATCLLLDNMPLPLLRQAVVAFKDRAFLEASGGVNLNSVRAIAETGVHAISVGALTHSVKAVDIGLDA